MKIKVGILGASGYAGNELVRILLNHPKVEISYLGSSSSTGQNYQDLYPNTPLNLCFENKNLDELELDLLFLATPHEFSAKLLNKNLLKKMKIIDLSADFRLKILKITSFGINSLILIKSFCKMQFMDFASFIKKR